VRIASPAMSDVAAVVLTLGERTTSRALESLEAQTLPVEDVVVVEGNRPFHRALNLGAERVATPYFVQVDADMVLDRDCVEVLRTGMEDRVGIAVGTLRDPLIGKLTGIKMFRRSCFELLRLRDTVAPEIDFYVSLERLGWMTRWLLGWDRVKAGDGTLGEHRPDYDLEYAYGTYYLLGRLYSHRGDARALQWRFTQLRSSAHEMAPIARLAMAQGILGSETRDIAKPRPAPAAASFLHRLTASRVEAGIAPDGTWRRWMAAEPSTLFESFRELGASLRAASHAGLRACLRLLGEYDHPRSLLAEVALGHGALTAEPPPAPGAVPVAFERLADAWAPREAGERAG